MLNKIAQIKIIQASFFILLFGLVFFSSSVFGILGLTDHTVYDEENNICSANNLNMYVDVYPCNALDADLRDITQYVDFEWKGGSPQGTSWVFMYEGELESGRMELAVNNSYNRTIHTEQWVDDYLIQNIISYENITGFDDECFLGTSNNNNKFNVTINTANSTEIFPICFEDYSILNSTSIYISGWTELPEEEIYYQIDWVDISGSINYLG